MREIPNPNHNDIKSKHSSESGKTRDFLRENAKIEHEKATSQSDDSHVSSQQGRGSLESDRDSNPVNDKGKGMKVRFASEVRVFTSTDHSQETRYLTLRSNDSHVSSQQHNRLTDRNLKRHNKRNDRINPVTDQDELINRWRQEYVNEKSIANPTADKAQEEEQAKTQIADKAWEAEQAKAQTADKAWEAEQAKAQTADKAWEAEQAKAQTADKAWEAEQAKNQQEMEKMVDEASKQAPIQKNRESLPQDTPPGDDPSKQDSPPSVKLDKNSHSPPNDKELPPTPLEGGEPSSKELPPTPLEGGETSSKELPRTPSEGRETSPQESDQKRRTFKEAWEKILEKGKEYVNSKVENLDIAWEKYNERPSSGVKDRTWEEWGRQKKQEARKLVTQAWTTMETLNMTDEQRREKAISCLKEAESNLEEWNKPYSSLEKGKKKEVDKVETRLARVEALIGPLPNNDDMKKALSKGLDNAQARFQAKRYPKILDIGSRLDDMEEVQNTHKNDTESVQELRKDLNTTADELELVRGKVDLNDLKATNEQLDKHQDKLKHIRNQLENKLSSQENTSDTQSTRPATILEDWSEFAYMARSIEIGKEPPRPDQDKVNVVETQNTHNTDASNIHSNQLIVTDLPAKRRVDANPAPSNQQTEAKNLLLSMLSSEQVEFFNINPTNDSTKGSNKEEVETWNLSNTFGLVS